MKKITLIMGLLIALNLYGADKAECEKLFRNAISNFYLENTCKYDKHISSKIRKVFENQNCEKLFTSDDMKSLNSEVLGNSYKIMNAIGRDAFCQSNKSKYKELENIYLKKHK